METLGISDIVITEYRKRLVSEIRAHEAGEVAPVKADHALPIAIDAIAPADAWEPVGVERDLARRRGSDWASALMS